MSDVRQGLFDLLKGIIDDEWGPYGDDYYWDMVDAELPRLGLHKERRLNEMSSGGMTTDYKTGITTSHSDYRYDQRWVTDWTPDNPT